MTVVAPNDVRASLGLERLCECGCGQSLDGLRANARYATTACRTRAWKERTHYRDARAAKASRNAAPRKPALRISYLRALDAIEALLADYEPSRLQTPRERAENVLRPLLGPKARRHA